MAGIRRVPEDVLEYYLYPLICEDLNDEELFEYLEEQKDIYLAHLSHLLVDYIWQNEALNLRPIPGNGKYKFVHIVVVLVNFNN